MNAPRFLQIHTLTSHAASLLNRDEVGLAKRVPFGGATRTRISSQCLKRHWRTFEGDGNLASILGAGQANPLAVRSRRTFDAFINDPLVSDGFPADLAASVTEALIAEVVGESPKAKKAKAEKDENSPERRGRKKAGAVAIPRPIETREPIETNNVTVLGRVELDFLLGLARTIAKSASSPKLVPSVVERVLTKACRENLRALRRNAGVDGALFGRMVTSDILARVDGAVHVAHAFTTHAEASENDYFSAVDDLRLQAGELGSGHISASEISTGLFYGYVVIDVPLLVTNLEGGDRQSWISRDRDLSAKLIERLVTLIATVSPGAKLGATAPYAYAHMVLAEAGNAQPRSFANAFLRPVENHSDIVASSYDALGRHIQDLDGMYGSPPERKIAALGGVSALSAFGAMASQAVSLDGLASWLAAKVR